MQSPLPVVEVLVETPEAGFHLVSPRGGEFFLSVQN